MNNPFETNDKNSNSFEPKNRRSGKTLRNTIIIILVLIINAGIVFWALKSNTNNSEITTQEELSSAQPT